MVTHDLITALGRQMQADLYEFPSQTGLHRLYLKINKYHGKICSTSLTIVEIQIDTVIYMLLKLIIWQKL